MSAALDRAHARQLRRLFLGVVTGSFVFLLAWIGYLAVSLPSDRQVHQWRIAWLGFDIALVAAVGITALCAWGRRQIFIPWATITATLLCCDAWFDIVLDWNTPDLPLSLLSAGLGELPLAGLLFYTARRLIRLSLQAAWSQAGHRGPLPRFSRIPLFASLPQALEGSWEDRMSPSAEEWCLMIGKLQCVVLDCHYPAGLAHFYATVLGGDVDRPDPRWTLDEEWSTLHTPDGWILGFQRVEDYRPPMWPDPAHPQQMHLDIDVEDIDAAEAKVLKLGAELKDRELGWRVYLDPAGHPFCLVQAAKPAA